MDGNHVVFELYFAGGRTCNGYISWEKCISLYHVLRYGTIFVLVCNKKETKIFACTMCVYLSFGDRNSIPPGRIGDVGRRCYDSAQRSSMCS